MGRIAYFYTRVESDVVYKCLVCISVLFNKTSSNRFHTVCCLFQLTIDVAWSPACIDKRCFDYVSLADIADFIFIMAYDERSQVFGPCVAWANSALNMTLWGTFCFGNFFVFDINKKRVCCSEYSKI